MNNVIASDRVEPKIPKNVVKYISREFNALMNRDYDNPVKIMDDFYKLFDVALKHLGKSSVCTRGCSHCCYVNVAATDLEVAYIEYKTGDTVTNYDKQKLTDKTGEKCRFLVNNECSIYEYRPAACRAFFTIDDPKFCADDTYPEHLVSGLTAEGDDAPSVMYREFLTHRFKDLKIKHLHQFFE